MTNTITNTRYHRIGESFNNLTSGFGKKRLLANFKYLNNNFNYGAINYKGRLYLQKKILENECECLVFKSSNDDSYEVGFFENISWIDANLLGIGRSGAEALMFIHYLSHHEYKECQYNNVSYDQLVPNSLHIRNKYIKETRKVSLSTLEKGIKKLKQIGIISGSEKYYKVCIDFGKNIAIYPKKMAKNRRSINIYGEPYCFPL